MLALGVGSKWAPLMVTLVPGPPESGVKPEISGGGSTTNCWLEVASRPLASTVIAPVAAPTGTSTLIELGVDPVMGATTPPIMTTLLAGSGSKLEPITSTVRPMRPAVGLKLMIEGGSKLPSSSTQPTNWAVMVLLGKS
ncbi:hypothetical protein D3C78_1527400 [compost metagenome]